MRSLTVVFALLCATSAAAADTDALARAQAECQRTGRALIVCVGAPWCGPCREVDRLYAAALKERGVYLHLDVQADAAVLSRLPSIRAIPTVICYDRDARGQWTLPRVVVGLPEIGRFVAAKAR